MNVKLSFLITATDKSDVLEKLKTQSNAKIIDGFIASGSLVQNLAGLSQVPSKSSIRHFRQSILKKSDLHEDALKDLILRSLGPNKDFVRSLDVINFSVLLMKDTQLDVLQLWIERNKFRRASLDATGSILRSIDQGPPLLHHVLLIPVQVADDENSMPFNLAELITSSQSMMTIKHFLENVGKLVNDHKPTKLMFHEVVTDKSFANIGAILMAFNNLTLTDYLNKCWDILTITDKKQKNKAIKGLTVVRLCSSHTCKTMKDLVGVHFKNKSENLTVCGMIGHMFNINDLTMLLTYCENFLFCLMSQNVGPKMIAAGEENKLILARSMGCGQLVDLIKQEEDGEKESRVLNIEDEEEHKVIYKSSKVFQHLRKFIDACEFDPEGQPNKFFSPAFAKDFNKCHLSYILLWANPMTAIRSTTAARANNGIIENSFHMKKREVRENKFTIGGFGNIKIGRFVKFSSDIIDLRVKKILMNIPAKSRSKKPPSSLPDGETENDILNSKEMYCKRNPREKTRSRFFISASSSCSSQSRTRTLSQPSASSQTNSQSSARRRSSSLTSNIEENNTDFDSE